MRKSILLGATVVGLGLCTGLVANAEGITVWPVDPHVKVFRDLEPPASSGAVTLRAARNEYEPAQIAFRVDRPWKSTTVEITPLAHADGEATIGGEAIAWDFVGFIPLKKNTPSSEALQLRAAPCDVPDPLLEARTMDVEPGSTQPVWITVHVPEGAVPGLYRGQVAVVAGNDRATLPVELLVDPFTLSDERHLLVTNWFNTGNIAKAHGVEIWSEAFWSVLERYAQNMAAHRQNVVYTPWTLIAVTQEPDGKLSFDYGRFDRFIELFQRAGAADRIEITHVGHFGRGGWGAARSCSAKSRPPAARPVRA